MEDAVGSFFKLTAIESTQTERVVSQYLLLWLYYIVIVGSKPKRGVGSHDFAALAV